MSLDEKDFVRAKYYVKLAKMARFRCENFLFIQKLKLDLAADKPIHRHDGKRQRH